MGAGASVCPDASWVVDAPVVVKPPYELLEEVDAKDHDGGTHLFYAIHGDTGAFCYIKTETLLISRAGGTGKGSLRTELLALRHLHERAPGARHDGIVYLSDCFYSGDSLFVVTRAAACNMDLFGVIEAGLLNDKLNRPVCASLANTVAFVHGCGIAHMDLKPENVFVDDIEKGAVRLGDFAMARFVHEDKKSSRFLGTLAFMAPEVYAGEVYDPRAADIYSLGMLFLFITTRSHLYLVPDDTKSGAFRFRNHFCEFNVAQITQQYASFLAMVRSRKWADSLIPMPQDFLDLFFDMVQSDPSKRPTIKDVCQSKWIRGVV